MMIIEICRAWMKTLKYGHTKDMNAWGNSTFLNGNISHISILVPPQISYLFVFL